MATFMKVSENLMASIKVYIARLIIQHNLRIDSGA